MQPGQGRAAAAAPSAGRPGEARCCAALDAPRRPARALKPSTTSAALGLGDGQDADGGGSTAGRRGRGLGQAVELVGQLEHDALGALGTDTLDPAEGRRVLRRPGPTHLADSQRGEDGHGHGRSDLLHRQQQVEGRALGDIAEAEQHQVVLLDLQPHVHHHRGAIQRDAATEVCIADAQGVADPRDHEAEMAAGVQGHHRAAQEIVHAAPLPGSELTFWVHCEIVQIRPPTTGIPGAASMCTGP